MAIVQLPHIQGSPDSAVRRHCFVKVGIVVFTRGAFHGRLCLYFAGVESKNLLLSPMPVVREDADRCTMKAGLNVPAWKEVGRQSELKARLFPVLL